MVARSKVATIGILWLLSLVAVMAATEEQIRIVQLEADKEAMTRRLMVLEQAFAQAQPAGASWPSGCHCPHVDKLIDEMRAVQGDVGRLHAFRPPLIPAGAPN